MDKKSCYNCKYFIRHYMWWHDHFIETNFGHCSQFSTKQFYKNYTPQGKCDKWCDNEGILNERNDFIEFQYRQMVRSIRDIALYIKTLNKD